MFVFFSSALPQMKSTNLHSTSTVSQRAMTCRQFTGEAELEQLNGMQPSQVLLVTPAVDMSKCPLLEGSINVISLSSGLMDAQICVIMRSAVAP